MRKFSWWLCFCFFSQYLSAADSVINDFAKPYEQALVWLKKNNKNKAILLLERAGNLGNPDAMIKLGEIYKNHPFTGQNHPAIPWFEKAHAANDNEAALHIAEIYKNGFFHSDALYWYNAAKQRGNNDAIRYLRIDLTRNSFLVQSAKAGDLAAVTEAIKRRGAHVDGFDIENQHTALFEAAQAGHLQIVKVLLEHGASVSTYPVVETSPITAAARNGHDEILTLLLEKSGNPVKKVLQNALRLTLQRCNKNLDIYRALNKHGFDLGALGFKGQSALKMAIECKNPQLVELYLKDPQGQVAAGGGYQSAFLYAIKSGHIDIMKKIAALGGYWDEKRQAFLYLLKNDLDRYLHYFYYPPFRDDQAVLARLLELIRANQYEKARDLLTLGINLNQSLDLLGGTPLMVAARNGQTKIMRLLIQHGASVTLKTGAGTALRTAAMYGQFTAFKFLVENGADSVDVEVLESSIEYYLKNPKLNPRITHYLLKQVWQTQSLNTLIHEEAINAIQLGENTRLKRLVAKQ